MTRTTTIMKTDTMIMIHMSLKCLKSLRNFYSTSEMQSMREWCMKCKIYTKTRKLIMVVFYHEHDLHCVIAYILFRFPKLSDQFFDKAPWPSENEVKTIMDDDKVL